MSNFNPAAEMRRSHMTLGYDKTEYEPTHHRDYPWRVLSTEERAQNTGQAAKQRESHIRLGDDIQDFETTSGSSFQHRGTHKKPEAIVTDTRKVNYSLGFDKPSYDTDYRSQFAWKARTEDDEAEKEHKTKIMENLRATHFVLGDDAPVHRSTTHEQFDAAAALSAKDHQSMRQEAKERADSLKKIHYKLGFDQPTWETTNHMPAFPDAQRIAIVKPDTHSTNFRLGDDQSEWVTQSMVDQGIQSTKIAREPDSIPTISKTMYERVMRGETRPVRFR